MRPIDPPDRTGMADRTGATNHAQPGRLALWLRRLHPPPPAPVTTLNHAALARALAWLQQPLAQAPAPGQRPPLQPSQSPLRVLLLSPNRADVLFLRRQLPQAELTIVTRREWDLDQPPALGVGPFDWAIASNVLHYATDPARWLRHIALASPCLVLQDLIERRRGPAPPYLAADGDAMRYQHTGQAERSSFAQAFDLARLQPAPVYFEAFDGATNAYHDGLPPPRHFCAVLSAADASTPAPKFATQLRRAASMWGYRTRLLCFRFWPLYVAYKGFERLRLGPHQARHTPARKPPT